MFNVDYKAIVYNIKTVIKNVFLKKLSVTVTLSHHYICGWSDSDFECLQILDEFTLKGSEESDLYL